MSLLDIKFTVSYVCNLSLCEGIFPKQPKIAEAVPLYKANDSTVFNNYRPVSKFYALSKVYERVIYERLLPILNFLQISIWI